MLFNLLLDFLGLPPLDNYNNNHVNHNSPRTRRAVNNIPKCRGPIVSDSFLFFLTLFLIFTIGTSLYLHRQNLELRNNLKEINAKIDKITGVVEKVIGLFDNSLNWLKYEFDNKDGIPIPPGFKTDSFNGNSGDIEKNKIKENDVSEEVKKFLDKVKEESPLQPRESFFRILSGVNGAIAKNDPRPATIAFLIPDKMENKEFANCFLDKISSGLNEILSHTQSSSIKKMAVWDFLRLPFSSLQKELSSYFLSENGKIVLIEDVDKINSPELLLLLQAFIDNLVPAHKEALYFFPIRVGENAVNKWDENTFGITYEVLVGAWEGLIQRDKISGLVSKVANYNILIKDGDSC